MDEQKQDAADPMFVPEDLGSATVITVDRNRQQKRNNFKVKKIRH